jgi:cytochrome c oxidase assembly protein subunit 15
MGVHGLVEFGNRLLTFVLGAAVLAAVAVAWRAGRRDLVRPAVVLLLGILAQALLGGVTVLTGLNPVTVMAHFLVSMALIAVAVVAHERARGEPRPARPVPRELVLGGRLLVAVTALTLFLGTVVTGTGPHSGDRQAADRLPFDLAEVTQLHADAVFLLLGLAGGLLLAVRAAGTGPAVRHRAGLLLVVLLGQGTVGFLQYATDLPVLLVGAHVLGAALVWIAALRLVVAMAPAVARAPDGPAVPGALVGTPVGHR